MCPDAYRQGQVQTFDRGRKTLSTSKQPMPLLWQPRAHHSPVPSKACKTSSASCGNSPKYWKTRTSSHSRSHATRSHPAPPLQRLLFSCWSQSQLHSTMWTSFVFQKKYHKCQHWWTLTPPLFSSTKHLSPDTTFMWSRSQPLFRWRLLMGEPLLLVQSHTRQPLLRQARGKDCSQHHLNPSPSRHPWSSLAGSTQPYHRLAIQNPHFQHTMVHLSRTPSP
jgi:hypothetical protein